MSTASTPIRVNPWGIPAACSFSASAAPDLAATTVDAHAGLEGDVWNLTFFARNIFDRRHATSAFSRYIFPVALVPLNADAIQPDPRRILGAELRVRF